jgi:hypothetical protein
MCYGFRVADSAPFESQKHMDLDTPLSLLKEGLDRPGRNDVQQFDQAAFHRWYSFILGFSDQLGSELINFSVCTIRY